MLHDCVCVHRAVQKKIAVSPAALHKSFCTLHLLHTVFSLSVYKVGSCELMCTHTHMHMRAAKIPHKKIATYSRLAAL